METGPNIKAGIMNSSIRTSESCSQLTTALHKIQTQLKPIEKKGQNVHQKYAYAKFEDYVEGIKEVLSAEGLTIVTTVGEPKRLEPRKTHNGGFQYVVEVAITARLFHKSGEWIEIDCYGEGQDSGDKAIYKAITGARKYALACLLGLSTTDDPEKDQDEAQQQAKQEKQKPAFAGHKPGKMVITTPEPEPPASPKPTVHEIEASIAKAVSAINLAADGLALREVFKEQWKRHGNIVGNGHGSLGELKNRYEIRKAELNKQETTPTEG